MIQKGSPIVFGTGQNLRSLSYIDHVVQAIRLALKSPPLRGDTFWIADQHPYPTIEIYETIAELLGVKKFRPRFIPELCSEVAYSVDAMIQRCGFYQQEIHVAGEMNKNIACSVAKAERELGFVPKVSLREGMKRSIEWCRKNGIDL